MDKLHLKLRQRRRTLGEVNGAAASKMAPLAGKPRICSTLWQSGSTWAYNPQGQGDVQGVAGRPKFRGAGAEGGRSVNCSEPSPTLHCRPRTRVRIRGARCAACVSMARHPHGRKKRVRHEHGYIVTATGFARVGPKMSCWGRLGWWVAGPVPFDPKKGKHVSRLNRDPALGACGCLVTSTGFARV